MYRDLEKLISSLGQSLYFSYIDFCGGISYL